MMAPNLYAFDGPGGRVVDPRPIFLQPPLEGRSVFSDVVGKARQPAEALTVETHGECGAAPRRHDPTPKGLYHLVGS